MKSFIITSIIAVLLILLSCVTTYDLGERQTALEEWLLPQGRSDRNNRLALHCEKGTCIEGKGTLSWKQYFSGFVNSEGIYTGSFKKGHFHGKGSFVLQEYLVDSVGSYKKYDGNFQLSRKHGEGVLSMYDKDGNMIRTYTGEFSEGKLHGKVAMTQTLSSSPGTLTRFTGEYQNGMRKGQGSLYISVTSDGVLKEESITEGNFYDSNRLDGEGRKSRTVYDESGNIIYFDQVKGNFIVTVGLVEGEILRQKMSDAGNLVTVLHFVGDDLPYEGRKVSMISTVFTSAMGEQYNEFANLLHDDEQIWLNNYLRTYKRPYIWYEGEMQDGKFHGQGELREWIPESWEKGRVIYSGQWFQGKRIG